MNDESANLPAPAAEVAPVAPPPPAPAPPRHGPARSIVVIVALVAVVAALYFGWRWWTREQGQRAAADAGQRELEQRVESLARGGEQARREVDTLRARLDDAAKVNASLREQLLGLAERAKLTEDALANLADKRLSGHDAMLLNEAEMLLALGAQRYTLFHDVQGTVDAYKLADTALAAADDAAFSTVRQSISAEIDALGRAPDTAGALATLARLRAAALQLPPPARELAAGQAGESRWLGLLGQFVRVRHGDAATAQRHEIGLARQLLVLDLRDAEAALLAHDGARLSAALADARRLLQADFDAGAAAVTAARADLDQLDKLDVAAAPPALLGASLKELRNLRATHALHDARPAPPPADTPKSAEDRS